MNIPENTDNPDLKKLLIRAVSYYENGNILLSIKLFKKILLIAPEEVKIHISLGLAYMKSNEYKEALDCFLIAIRLDPESFFAHNMLRRTLNILDDPIISKNCYKNIYKIHPRIAQNGPMRIRIESSSACNLRCQHCPTGLNYNRIPREVMSMDVFDQIVIQIKDIPFLKEGVLYLSGEPLLNKNIFEMSKQLKEKTNINFIMLNTNGMLLNEEICKKIANSGIDRISISIDGESPEENDQIRVNSDYKMIENNIRILLKYYNKEKIVIVNTKFKKSGDPKMPTVPDYLLKAFPVLNIDVDYAMKWPGLDTDKSFFKNLSLEKSTPEAFCDMPFTEISIKTNGDVVLCCYDLLGETIIGNILNKTITEIFEGADYSNLRQNIVNDEVTLLPLVCKKCSKYTGKLTLVNNHP